MEEHGRSGASTDAPVLRQRQGLDDDAGPNRQGTAGAAAVNLVGPDGARSGRSEAARRSRDAGRSSPLPTSGPTAQHAGASWPLELHCGAIYPESRVQRSAGGTGVCAAQHGPARCRRGMLGHEVFLLQSTSLTHRSDLKSVIGLPNFPSYTSGHSTFSGSAAEVLSYLFPKAARPTSRRRRRKPRYPGCMGAFTIGPTSKSARPTANGSEYTVSFARTDGADVP